MKKENNDRQVTLSRRTLLMLLLLVLLLVAGGIILGMNWGSWFGPEQAPTTAPTEPFTPELDPNAEKWTQPTLPDRTGSEQVGIKIPGYPSITIPADTKDVTMALLNPEGNPCYFTFKLVLKDTGETLYTSGMVAPGDVITDVTLSRPLEAGEYNATIQISTASLEDGGAMNGANVETLLIVRQA